MGHEEPAPLFVLGVGVLPGLVGQLAVDLVAEGRVLEALVDDVVSHDLE